MSKFKVVPPKPPVDPEQLEKFAAASDPAMSAAQLQPAVPALSLAPAQQLPANLQSSGAHVSSKTAERTRSFPLRLTPTQFNRIDEVFRRSTYKSKQTMGEELFLQAIEEYAKKVGI